MNGPAAKLFDKVKCLLCNVYLVTFKWTQTFIFRSAAMRNPSVGFQSEEEMTEGNLKKCYRPLWLDENLMWVRLLAGPWALESLVKVSSKSGAPARG